MKNYKKIDINSFEFAPFKWLDKDWALLTAKKRDDSVNTMTVSWGGFGIMWNIPVIYATIRPQRFTKEFVDDSLQFSLCFFKHEDHKKDLDYLGKISGRDQPDKILKTSLTLDIFKDIPYFKEAHTVINTDVVFSQQLASQSLLHPSLNNYYKNKDYHSLYISKITSIFQK